MGGEGRWRPELLTNWHRLTKNKSIAADSNHKFARLRRPRVLNLSTPRRSHSGCGVSSVRRGALAGSRLAPVPLDLRTNRIRLLVDKTSVGIAPSVDLLVGI